MAPADVRGIVPPHWGPGGDGRRTGILAVGAPTAELLPRGARPADRPIPGQRYRAEPGQARPAAAADARVSARGRQREAGRLSPRPEPGYDPSVRDRSLSPFRRR